MHGEIHIRGARTHNLKNIDLDIPRDQLVVITGLSGSGKSSLAFDTLYAEGQRRYVESLSAYARQFLDLMERPDVDLIEGLSPAIAIEQKAVNSNPRSTVGTITEIMDYLRLLFARAGVPYCPVHGLALEVTPVSDMVDRILQGEPEAKIMILAPVVRQKKLDFERFFQDMQTQGFIRFKVDGVLYEAETLPELDPRERHDVDVVVDRLKIRQEASQRLAESLETALRLADGRVVVENMQTGERQPFSSHYCCPECGYSIEELEPRLFSFNNPMGACPVCNGMGQSMVFTEKSVVCHPELSLSSGAIHGWDRRNLYNFDLIEAVAKKVGFDVDTPWNQLKRSQQEAILWGLGDQTIEMPYRRAGSVSYKKELFEGVIAILNRRYAETQNEAVKEELNRYRELKVCDACNGTRLKEAARHVFIGQGKQKKAIFEITAMPLSEALAYFRKLRITGSKAEVGKKLVAAIAQRLTFLNDVGLGYLTLNRLSNSLSGGESQRINLATSLGSSLVGSLYILDEPSIGLHSRDTDRLLHVLRQLQQLGNTVVVVEHDEEIIRAADYIIDIGPNAGRLGGEVVYQGDMKDLKKGSNSYTVRYLLGEDEIPVPEHRRPWNNYIELKGARENNLKGVNVRIPLNVMTVVTGVSGSGKSTLVRDIFFRALKRELDECSDRPGEFSSIGGSLRDLRNVEFVDQNPIGKSSRSNPVTYIKAYDEIRKLWSEQPLAKQMGYTPGFFSFNSEGGRCEECKGEGTITVEMQFMADLVLECESCHGKRFKSDTLEVKFNDKSIYDVLEMTVNQAVEFFNEHGQKKIVKKLLPLQDVGLGYIKLGQSSSTLSGGENQRVKLAFYLSQEKADPTMFIFDEPTTGLHFHDIRKLLDAFDALIRRGHSIVIIEHNMDVIKCADYVIDLGPEGGDKGGNIVAVGTPEEVAACGASYTGQFLKEKLG